MRKWDSRLILWCQKSISEWFETRIVVSKDSYWLLLWCQKSISEVFETHIVVSKVHFCVIWESGKFGLKKGTGVDPPRPAWTMSPFFTVFFLNESVPKCWVGIFISQSDTSFLNMLMIDRHPDILSPPEKKQWVSLGYYVVRLKVRAIIVSIVVIAHLTFAQRGYTYCCSFDTSLEPFVIDDCRPRFWFVESGAWDRNLSKNSVTI